MRAVIRDRNGGLNFITRVCNEYGEQFQKPLTITVRPFQSVRSPDQNSKIHVMIRDLAEFTGYSEKQMKELAKAQFGPWKYMKLGDKQRQHPKSTAEYTRLECSDFIERLYQLGAEIGCQFSETP